MQYCHEHKLPYVVDPTNANPAYTSRNAFRFTLQDLQKRTGAVDQDSGPVCFFRRWASRLATRRARLEQRLKSLMTNVEKDAPVKTACMFDPARIRKMRSEVRKLFLSQVARQVSPATDNSSISPSSMEKLDEAIFGYRKARQSAVNRLTPGAGVMFTAKHVYGRKYWIVSRQPMRKLEHMEASYRLSDTDWHLWDNRFWCRSRLKDMARLPSPVIIKPEDPWTLPAVSVGQPEAADIETARKAAAGVSLSRVELASSPLGDQTVEIVEVGGRSSKTCAV